MKNVFCIIMFSVGLSWCLSAVAQTASAQIAPSKEASSQQADEVPWIKEMGIGSWYPNRFNVTESLNDASVHYRKGELRAAKAEIEEAVAWLRTVKARAVEKPKAEIEAVIRELEEVASQLDIDKSVSAKRLNQAFANANLALARHHFSKANKLAEQSDLLNASRRLVAAADHMKNAAYTANVAASPIVGTFRDEYSPFGMVNEKLELTPEQLQGDLEQLALALKSLGAKMQDKSVE